MDLLDHGNSTDAGEVIEKTTREIEHAHDDRLIYARHGASIEQAETLVDLDEEEAEKMLDDEGMEITEAEDVEASDDADALDLGEEL